MNWLSEILKGTENAENIERLIEEGIKREFVPVRDYEILKHENNILNNMNNDYKRQIEDNEYFTRFNELNEKYEAETARLNGIISENTKRYLIEKEIAKAGGRNPKAIMALLDMEKIGVDEEGLLTGLDLTELMESDPYLFDIVKKSVEGTGGRRAEPKINREDAFLYSARRAAGLE